MLLTPTSANRDNKTLLELRSSVPGTRELVIPKHTFPVECVTMCWKSCSPTRRETVEHPFGTLKMRMGATHFLVKTLPKVATEMALHVLAYTLARVMNLLGSKPLLAAIRA